MPTTCTKYPRLTSWAVLLTLSAVLTACAFKVAPEGGPRDTTPPTVIGSDPASGTTSFSGNAIAIRFSTYVDRAVTQAVTVQPATRIRTTYAGDEITIALLDTLIPNTTYAVTLGTSWADMRGNRPALAPSIIFATGPAIDTGKVSGTVQGASLDNVVVFCHPMVDDTSYAPRRTPARYRTPIGVTGDFVMRGLPDGRYRLLAVRDANRNGVVDPGEDLGTATRDAVISGGGQDDVTMTLAPARDRVPPSVTRVRAIDQRVLHITCNERIDSSALTPAAVTVFDSTGSAQHVDAVWTVPDRPEVFAVRLTEVMQPGRYRLRAAAGSIRDSAGLVNVDTSEQTFTASTRPHDARMRIRSVTMADSARGVRAPWNVGIGLDAPPDAIAVKAVLVQDTTDIPVSVTTHGAAIDVRPTMALANATMYTLRCTIGADTSIRRTFTTGDRVDPGTFSGVVIDEAAMAERYVLRLLDDRKNVVRSLVVRGGDTINVEALPPATYAMDVIVDGNGDMTLQTGDVEPWTFGEARIPVSATVQIRPRWTIDDVRIIIPKPVTQR